MFSVIRFRKFLYAFSAISSIGALILIFSWGLRPGIDFRGGVLLEARFEQPVSSSQIRETLGTNGYNTIVQLVDDHTALIKAEPQSQEESEAFKKIVTEKVGKFTENRFELIGPAIGKELASRAYWQIILVCLGIIIYIAYSFRRVSGESKKTGLTSWKLGLAAVLALIHDLILTVGIFAVMGKFRGVEIDSLFVTALLTILGFSVHDTIVVFDRIRENLEKNPSESFANTIDYSINSTLARSINTTSTIIFVLIAMLLFGGQSIYYFVLTLLIGLTIGTYSSIFIASPLLYSWQKQK